MAARSAGLKDSPSVMSQTLSMRSRSRPSISRSWRCMKSRLSQAVSQAEGPTVTNSHWPFNDCASTALPSSRCKARFGRPRVGVISVP